MRQYLQHAIIALARPYVSRELPGWGKIYRSLVGAYERDWFWQGAPIKQSRGKLHGYVQHLALSEWPARANYFLRRWYDLELQLLIIDTLRRGDTVIDVGAHCGDFALLASRLVGSSGKVICFEPNSYARKKFEREIKTNAISNIVVHSVGLSNEEGEFKQDPFTNTLYKTRENGFSVRVVRGDDLLSLERPDFIKMDIEGFECKALSGLSRTIERSYPIIVTEISAPHLSECGSTVAELVNILRGHGYQGYRLGLEKRGLSYSWNAENFDFEGNGDPTSYDAVWVHPKSRKLEDDLSISKNRL